MTACDASIDVSDYGTCECFEEHYPVARKPHVCCECGAAIQPGERYQRSKGLWEGHWWTEATCDPCSRIRNDFCPGGSMYGGLRDQIQDACGFDYLRAEHGGEA